MRKIRNFLCFFICSFHLNCPTTEEQITDRQVLLGVTQKVSSNSKHTLLCLCGHNVLARIKPNTIENTAVVRPSGWRRKASKERLVFRYVQRMKQINPGKETAIHSFCRLTCFCKIQANDDSL